MLECITTIFWGLFCLPAQVRNKLAQLVNVRRHKMEEGLRQISGTATVRVNGLGAYELNLIRNNFQGALDMFLKLEAVRQLELIAESQCIDFFVVLLLCTACRGSYSCDYFMQGVRRARWFACCNLCMTCALYMH
jgi:hypothetical protein